QFQSVPPQFDAAGSESAASAPWPELFAAAGLPMASFSPVAPQWTPRDFADARVAWEGLLPDSDGVRVRVEAASYRGRPISFTIVAPWSRATRMQPLVRSTFDRIATVA